jgi:large subunit ribosomal protein L15
MTTKLHHLKPAEGAKTDKKRVARGDRGRGGKTAGRGTKGTGARGTVPAGFEGGQLPMIRRQPKRPGFNNPNKVVFAVINVAASRRPSRPVTRSPSRCCVPRAWSRRSGPVKVLGHGEITKSSP